MGRTNGARAGRWRLSQMAMRYRVVIHDDFILLSRPLPKKCFQMHERCSRLMPQLHRSASRPLRRRE
jgi:hypothetical protein